MAKRNKSILPGLIDKGKKPSSLDGIKNTAGNRGSSALPIMKYFGDVKPSRNERIIKPDMTSGGKVAKQDLPIIREVLKPGFSGNFRTNYTPVVEAPSFSFSNALSFDGVNDGVTFASSVDKPALTSGFSFSMWVRFDSALVNEWILGSSSSANMWFRIDPTLVIFRSRGAGSATTFWNVPAFSTGTWYHVAVSLVNTVNELWVNGTKYTGDIDDYDNENISFDQIGVAGSSYGQFVIDELAIKSGAGLSQADVDALYNGGAGAFATDVMTPDVYYRFNESEPSATTADSSGNANTGTVTGATFVAY